MKKLAILSAIFMFTALFAVASFAQTASDNAKKDDSSPLLAEWNIVFAAPGQDVPGTFKLEKDGDTYKGSVATDMSGEAPLKNVKLNADNSFTAEISVNVQGQSFEGTMSGKLDGDKLSGELNLSGLGAIPYTGKKAEKK